MCTRGHACAGGLGRCPFESATLAPHDVADVADLVSPAEARRVKPAAPSSKGLARGGWSQPPTVCESRRHRVGGLAFVREESRIGLQVRLLLRRRDGSAGRGLGIVTPEVWRGSAAVRFSTTSWPSRTGNARQPAGRGERLRTRRVSTRPAHRRSPDTGALRPAPVARGRRRSPNVGAATGRLVDLVLERAPAGRARARVAPSRARAGNDPGDHRYQADVPDQGPCGGRGR